MGSPLTRLPSTWNIPEVFQSDQLQSAIEEIGNLRINYAPTTDVKWIDKKIQHTSKKCLGFLGSGGFGCVYLLKDTEVKNKVYVLKIAANSQGYFKDDKIKNVQEEGNLLASFNKLKIPNIPIFEGFIEGVKGHYLMEYLPVDLYQLQRAMKDANLNFSLPHIRGMIYDVLLALDAMRSCGFIHRDLKPQNILVTFDRRPSLKVTDFGICAPYTTLGQPYYVQSLWYKSPGSLIGSTDGLDQFSLGLIIIEMFTLEAFLPVIWTKDDKQTPLSNVEQLSNLLELVFAKIKKPSSLFYSKILGWIINNSYKNPSSPHFYDTPQWIKPVEPAQDIQALVEPMKKCSINKSSNKPQSFADQKAPFLRRKLFYDSPQGLTPIKESSEQQESIKEKINCYSRGSNNQSLSPVAEKLPQLERRVLYNNPRKLNTKKESLNGLKIRTIIKPLIKRHIDDSSKKPQSEEIRKAIWSCRRIFTYEDCEAFALQPYIDLVLKLCDYENPPSYENLLSNPLFKGYESNSFREN